VSEAAGAYDNDGGPGIEIRERTLDGVVWSERGIAQRSRFCGTQTAKGYEQARRWNEHVVGHPTVQAESTSETLNLRPVLAVVLHCELARVAVTATPGAIDGDRVSFLELGHALSERGDPPRVFVTEREGTRESEILFHQVQIGVADASAADLDEDLARAR
jgi:hypothetical protein